MKRLLSVLARAIRSVRSTAGDWGALGLWYRATGNADGLYAIWTGQQAAAAAALAGDRVRSGDEGRLLGLVTFVARADEWPTGRSVASVTGQTHQRWEWLIVASRAVAAANAAAARDSRIRVVTQPDAVDRVAAWNAAVDSANAEFVALFDAGDELSPSSLEEIAAAIDRAPASDLIYSDEDALDPRGRRSAPCFKPSWSPELLLAGNYIGRLAMFRRRILAGLGGFRDFDDPEWDVHLRLSRQTRPVTRVPRCLYHRARPAHSGNVPSHSSDSPGGSALAAHCREIGLPATISRLGPGHCVTWPVPDDPLISIVVPNRNAPAIIAQCVRGILDDTSHPRRELLIVDNGSTDADVLQLYGSLQTSGRATIVPFDGPFNFSAACNAGAAAARGRLLLFLNNDIEVIDPDWLAELARWALRPEIGVVGAKLLYPDRRIQHDGVMFGIGLVGHLFNGATENTSGLFGSSETYRNCAAVTGACQMMRREVFNDVGGFDEGFRLSFSDVVLCLEAWKRGYRVMCTPQARLVHHESYTRKREDRIEDLQRLVQYLKHSQFFDDPFFHPELNPKSSTPALRPPFADRPAEVVRKYVDRVLAEAAAVRG